MITYAIFKFIKHIFLSRIKGLAFISFKMYVAPRFRTRLSFQISYQGRAGAALGSEGRLRHISPCPRLCASPRVADGNGPRPTRQRPAAPGRSARSPRHLPALASFLLSPAPSSAPRPPWIRAVFSLGHPQP